MNNGPIDAGVHRTAVHRALSAAVSAELDAYARQMVAGFPPLDATRAARVRTILQNAPAAAVASATRAA